MNKIEAQNKIATILKQLELYTGSSVVSVDIENISSMIWETATPRCERTVHIRMMAAPGSNWGQASENEVVSFHISQSPQNKDLSAQELRDLDYLKIPFVISFTDAQRTGEAVLTVLWPCDSLVRAAHHQNTNHYAFKVTFGNIVEYMRGLLTGPHKHKPRPGHDDFQVVEFYLSLTQVPIQDDLSQTEKRLEDS